MTDLSTIKPRRADLQTTAQMQLFAAVSQNDLRTARRLLAKGVPPDSGDEDDDTLLTLAAAHGHADMVRLLLGAGADMHLAGLNGRSALRAAIDGLHRECVDILLAAGADPLFTAYDVREQKEITDCMLAAKCKDTRIVFAVSGAADSFHMIEAVKDGVAWKAREWVGRDGCDVNACNRHGATALLHACQMGRPDLVEMLWQAGADPRKPCKYDASITPLRMAEESGNPHVIRQIREYLEKADQEFRREATQLGRGIPAMKQIRLKPKYG